MGKTKNKFDEKAGVSKGTVRRFMNAAHVGNLAAVTRAVEKYPTAVKWADASGYTALHYAAANGNVPLINYLLDKGADIEARNTGDSTPLHNAVEWERNIDAVKLLLDRGANINAVNSSKETPIVHAAFYSIYIINENSGFQVLRTLVERGANNVEAAIKRLTNVNPEPRAIVVEALKQRRKKEAAEASIKHVHKRAAIRKAMGPTDRPLSAPPRAVFKKRPKTGL